MAPLSNFPSAAPTLLLGRPVLVGSELNFFLLQIPLSWSLSEVNLTGLNEGHEILL